jgi:hypothetical protein
MILHNSTTGKILKEKVRITTIKSTAQKPTELTL